MKKGIKNSRKRVAGICLAGVIALLAAALFRMIPENQTAETDAFAQDIDFQVWDGETSGAEPAASGSSADLDFTEEEFSMQSGAGIRLNDWTGIRFRAWISEELAGEISGDKEKRFGFVIAPALYFQEAVERSGNADGSCDYVKALAALEGEGAKPALRMDCVPVQENGKWMVQGSVVSILYQNLNLDFTAVAYVETQAADGTASYRYAAFPEGSDCLSNARSVSYVASAALQDGSAEYSEEEREILCDLVFRGVDSAALMTEEYSDSRPVREIALKTPEPSGIFDIGESASLTAAVTVAYPEHEEYAGARSISFPVYWNSSDPSLFSVDRWGRVEAKAEGTAIIYACVGESSASVTVSCRKAEFYCCTIGTTDTRGLIAIQPTAAEVREGNTFDVVISVRDYENCQDLSFWIGENLYTTENGSLSLSLPVGADTEFSVRDISSALKFFKVTGTSIIAGTVTAKDTLPARLFLPAYSETGVMLTEIGVYAFRGNGNTPAAQYTKLTELWIPENYVSVCMNGRYGTFQDCFSLERIYLNNTALAEDGAISGTMGPTSWQHCNSLAEIFIPRGTLDAYSQNKFWGQKAGFLKEYPF